VKLYESLKTDSLYRNEDEEKLHKYGIYKKEELSGIYKNIMKKKHHAENPVRIIFENDTCVKCGIKGDRRLVKNSPCHTKEKQRHDKDENA
jgi:hypothetical protein